ncbi:uncharacterized protein MELLADRAFT_65676 [Melampsora larici-populina 98AG31]|uniref:Uncharacterized protein n=1 Tax=Melampsora larici-populina (strain 98AG31 / pathotype 3-4-7) TaxID=747676 RepID=F4RWB3_MELLP|nr:uncharacterized protein MELLADRAFT_65676 [Melampsora larici-populina 98AG31]EGG03255.1 hypothetical protein MELLADRAFT_65676 [Melampsora larici-populina 98AG31]
MTYGPRYTLHKFQGNEREVFTGDFKDDYVSYASGLERRAMEPDESADSVCQRPLVIHLDDTLSAPPPEPTVRCRTNIRRMCPDDYNKDGLVCLFIFVILILQSFTRVRSVYSFSMTLKDYESGKRRQAIRAAQEASQPQSSRKELLVIKCGSDEPLPVAGPSSPSETLIEAKLDSIVKVLRSHSLNSISEKLKTALEKTKGKMRSRAQSSVDQELSNSNPERTIKRQGRCLDAEAIQGALKEHFGLELNPATNSEDAYATPSRQSHDSDAPVYSQSSGGSAYSQSSG